jgi:hypothetical protein
MKKFLIRIALFSSLVVTYLALALWMDPFNVIHAEENQARLKSEQNISDKVNAALFRLQEFKRNPARIVIFGDSRANQINKLKFDSISGTTCYNLAIPGGSFPESMAMMREIVDHYPVDIVYFGVNFDIFNKLNNKNRVPEALQTLHSPIGYILSKNTMKSVYYLSVSQALGSDIQLHKPPGNRASFWNYQLDFTAANRVRNYIYPENFVDSLRSMAALCEQKGIELHLFIPPTHTDLSNKIQQLGLGADYARFKTELSGIAQTIDFDVPNEVTTDSSRFNDPFHGKEAVAAKVMEELWQAHLHQSASH